MNTSVIVWICIVGIFAVLMIANIAAGAIRRRHGMKMNRILSTGSEKEEFFVPGDSLNDDDAEYVDD